MANLVTGKIVGIGPVKTLAYPYGEDVAFLAYSDTPKPPDLGTLPFLTVLPMVATVDMVTLRNKWVKVTSPQIKNQIVWVELPRFQPDEPLPPVPPAAGKQYKVELTITGTISEITG